MRYTTTVLTEFDQELFDQCYADSIDILQHSFREYYNEDNIEVNKSFFEEKWKICHEIHKCYLIKITDTTYDIDLGYGVFRKMSDKSLALLHIMYKHDHLATTEWVLNFWNEFSREVAYKEPYHVIKVKNPLNNSQISEYIQVDLSETLIFLPNWAKCNNPQGL
jgi:hypothetical protein